MNLFFIRIYFQLDSDGDGQLSFEEFKVLFDNAEKRRKDSEIELQKSMNKVVYNVMNMAHKITLYTLQEASSTPCLLSQSETPSPRRKGCSFRDKKTEHQFSRLSLRGNKPRIIITKSSPDITAEGSAEEQSIRTKTLTKC